MFSFLNKETLLVGCAARLSWASALLTFAFLVFRFLMEENAWEQYVGLGRQAMHEGRLVDARGLLDQAIEASGFPDKFYQRALACLKVGKVFEGIDDSRKACLLAGSVERKALFTAVFDLVANRERLDGAETYLVPVAERGQLKEAAEVHIVPPYPILDALLSRARVWWAMRDLVPIDQKVMVVNQAVHDARLSVTFRPSFWDGWHCLCTMLETFNPLDFAIALAEWRAQCTIYKVVFEQEAHFKAQSYLFRLCVGDLQQLAGPGPAQVTMSVSLVPPGEELSQLKVAIFCMVKSAHMDTFQLSGAASLISQLPGMVNGPIPSTAETVWEEYKVAKKLIGRAGVVDIQPGNPLRQQLDWCRSFEAAYTPEKGTFLQEYQKEIDALKAGGRDQRLDISDAELNAFLGQRIGAFIVMGPLEEVFEQLRRRGGNPDVIVFEGHGHPTGLQQFCTKELLAGKTIGKALSKAGLNPKVVLFGSCESFEVARAAHAEYLACTELSRLFLGTTSNRPVREIFSGDMLPARFLSWFLLFLLRSSRGLETFGQLWNEETEGPLVFGRIRDFFWKCFEDWPLDKKSAQSNWFLDASKPLEEAIHAVSERMPKKAPLN